MALPAIVGLGALGTFLGGILVKFAEFLFSKVFKRIAILTIIVANFGLIVVALFSVISSSVKPLIEALPVEVTSTMGMIFPSNTTACVLAVITVELAIVTYKLALKAIEFQSRLV